MFLFAILYLVLTIIRPQDYLPAVAQLPLLPATLGLAALLWLFSRDKNFSAPQFILLPAFLLAQMVSLVANGWSGGALTVLANFGPTVIAFFVLADATSTRRRLLISMAVFTVCACVLALHGVDQVQNGGIGWTGMQVSEDGRIQYVGIFNDPNDLGLLFVMVLPMAFCLSGRGGILGRVFWVGAAALLLYGIYLTNSRGALLAVVAVAGIFVWRWRGPITAGVFSGIGLMGMTLLSARMQELDVDESSAAGRVDAWYSGLHMFLSQPLFGVGAGNFTEHNYLTAHNSFVLVLAETGLFGYVAWLAFVGYGFWMMFAILRHQPDLGGDAIRLRGWQEDRVYANTLLLAQCGFVAAAFFLSRSYTVVLYLLEAIVVGHYLGVRRRFPELRAFSLTAEGWRWLPIAAASIVVLFIVVAVLLRSG